MDLQKELLQTENYRDFLSVIFKNNSALSYSALALRAGFASRSYPREVVTGRRRITAKTLPQFIKGLKLTGNLKNYFSLLVLKDEADLNIQGLSSDEILNRLADLRLKTGKLKRVEDQSSAVLKSEIFLDIYASLGLKEKGHTLQEIMHLTGLNEEICKTHLKKMCDDQIVEYRNGTQCFAPTDVHLSIEALGGNEFFKKYYGDLTRQMVRRAEDHFNSKDHLYFTSTFSIQSHKAAEFKKQLRSLLLEFVDSAEDGEGDTLARISLGFEGKGL